MANNSYKSFKVKNEISPKTLLSIAIVVLGICSLFFMAGTGLKVTPNNSYKDPANVQLWNLVWGGGTYGVANSPALIVAFFLTIVGALFAIGISGFQYIAILSMLFFIAAGVLSFCAVPLCAEAMLQISSKASLSLGWASYAYGILNVLCGVGCVLAVRGD